MNKRMRTILIIILTLFSILGFSDRVFGMKYDDLNGYIYIDDDRKSLESLKDDIAIEDKEIDQICVYYQDSNKTFSWSDANYLVIYKDGTAGASADTVETCNNSPAFLPGHVCWDSYPIFNARNWCKNYDIEGDVIGDAIEDCNKRDASAHYKETKTCPKYMVRVADYGIYQGFFFDYTGEYTKIEALKDYANASTTGSDIYVYYNIAEPVLKAQEKTCEYGTKTDSTKASFKLNVKVPDEGFPYIETEIGSETKFGTDEHKLKKLYLGTVFRIPDNLKKFRNGCASEIKACRRSIGAFVDGSGLQLEGEITGYGLKECPSGTEKTEGEYTFYCIGDNCSQEENCEIYDSEFYKKLSNKLGEYNDNKNDIIKKREILNEYNILKDSFNSWCLSVLSTENYSEFGCVKKCIHVANEIVNLETKAGLRSPYGQEKCNIGEQVLFMVYNVLKWGKYIAPVLVIVLSILDFIKALAAQSDDEMKKAQGKFIKRLVVAALLFLIPLIINFALKTFGFYHSGCDITDLFSGSK